MTDRGKHGEQSEAKLNAAISAALVQVLHEFTGRGAMRARATLRENVVVCLMEQTLTRGELALVSADRQDQVLSLRREYQSAMGEPFIGAVERLTGCKVEAYLSANHIDPDLAAEIFVLSDGPDFTLFDVDVRGPGGGRRRSD